MTSPTIRRSLIIALEIAIALALLACVFFQTTVVPTALADEALIDPVVARSQALLTVVGIVGIACFEAVLIATGMLLAHSWNDRIFSRRSFLWVDVTLASCAAAAVLSALAMAAVLTAPAIPSDAFPTGASEATGDALLAGGFVGCVVCLTAALVVAVLRDLLKRAVALRSELDQVI